MTNSSTASPRNSRRSLEPYGSWERWVRARRSKSRSVKVSPSSTSSGVGASATAQPCGDAVHQALLCSLGREAQGVGHPRREAEPWATTTVPRVPTKCAPPWVSGSKRSRIPSRRGSTAGRAARRAGSSSLRAASTRRPIAEAMPSATLSRTLPVKPSVTKNSVAHLCPAPDHAPPRPRAKRPAGCDEIMASPPHCLLPPPQRSQWPCCLRFHSCCPDLRVGWK